MRQRCVRRATLMVCATILFGLGGAFAAAPASALSCFTVAGKMTCIDMPLPAGSGAMPPVIVPSGAWGEGDDHQIDIEDNGGRHVARG